MRKKKYFRKSRNRIVILKENSTNSPSEKMADFYYEQLKQAIDLDHKRKPDKYLV